MQFKVDRHGTLEQLVATHICAHPLHIINPPVPTRLLFRSFFSDEILGKLRQMCKDNGKDDRVEFDW